MSNRQYEKGQGLVSYALILFLVIFVIGLSICGIATFFGKREVGIFIAILIGLWVFARSIKFANDKFPEFFRQLRVLPLVCLTYMRWYQPEKHATHINIPAVVRRVIQVYEKQLQKYTITLKITPELLPNTIGNELLIEDIFHHFISNAIKYNKSANNPIIEIYSETGDNAVRYIIEDNGTNIPEHLQDRIFDWFFRIQHPQTYGLGIGLPIVRLLVTHIGGNYGVTNKSDGGNLFWFTLPQSTHTTAN